MMPTLDASAAAEGETPDGAVIGALEVLEVARDRLHDALREAAFSFVAAQREEEATRGCFVSYDAVPTLRNTLTPLLTVSQRSVQEKDNADEDDDESAQHPRASPWVLIEKQGERKPLVSSRKAASKRAAGQIADRKTKDSAPVLVDPIYYFSEQPSSALRDCQAAYRRVMQCVVEVASAQQRVLAAAEALQGSATENK